MERPITALQPTAPLCQAPATALGYAYTALPGTRRSCFTFGQQRLSCCAPRWPSQSLLPHTEGPGKDDGLREGDTLVTNHPVAAGGSHLPDITVITPVWEAGRIVFFVASRGHHADVGGISPGSMPPNSKSLAEEGATIVSFKLVRDGVFQVPHPNCYIAACAVCAPGS